MTINIWGRGFYQFLEEDWKMKTAVRTPTNAVTAKATVGNGLATPKFSRSPLPVAISTEMATAKPTIAPRPSHMSKPLPPSVLCSLLTETDAPPLFPLLPPPRGILKFNGNKGEPEAKVDRLPASCGT